MMGVIEGLKHATHGLQGKEAAQPAFHTVLQLELSNRVVQTAGNPL